MILTANIQGAADSRVALTPYTENGATIVKVAWNESGEKFKVYGYNSSRSDYSRTPTWFYQKEGTNQFEGDELPSTDNGTYLAVYGDDTESTTTPLQYFLNGQDGTLNDCQSISTENGTFYLHYVLMRDTIADLSTPIEFEHETAILKPTFKVGGIDIDKTITQIVMGNVIYPTTTNAGFEEITIIPHLAEQIQSASGTTFTFDDDIYIHLPIIYIPNRKYSPNHKFTFTVTAGGKEYTGSLTIPEDMSIVAGNLYTATIDLTPYLTFTVDGEQSQSLVLNVIGTLNSTIQYSADGGAWTKFVMNGTDATTPVPFTNNLRMRGKSEKGTFEPDDDTLEINGFMISFADDNTPVTCSGDIRTLVDYEDYENTSTENARFYGLFMNCSALDKASGLKLISNNKMAASCYESMFSGCTSLELAPALPATILAPSCYIGMFAGCSNLTTAPELPATTLAEYCYEAMFLGCESLTSAPEELPAMELKKSCYLSMFSYCTSLTSAPTLPATILADDCYNQMFNDCTSLNSVTMLATDISASNCLTMWMSGVAPEGTFTKNASLNQGTEIPGIPSGWTIVSQ